MLPVSEALVAHYHEVGLKGRNRRFFEETLARNLKRAMRDTGYRRVRRTSGRIVVDFKPESLAGDAAARAARVFGVAYLGRGRRVTSDMEGIRTAGLELMGAAPFETFAVRARRSHSSFPETSQTINIEVGRAIQDACGARVDLTNPDATLWIELFAGEAIVYRERLRGPGGLPVGVSGKMLALLSGGIDSPVAAWRMMRRGVEVELLHFHGQPFTDPSSARQAADLAEVLTRYQLHTVIHFVPLGDVQREIVTHTPPALRVVLYRRAMMRIAAALAGRQEADALVTGDSLGQVASQTVQNLKTVNAAVPAVEVFRPLVGTDKQEIVDLARQIGTYEISTRAHQDCCVLFEPRSPATRSYPDQAERAEAGLDVDALVGKALAGIETRVLELPSPAAG